MKPQAHPAKWSPGILEVFSSLAAEVQGSRVLDPFAGVGTERLRRALALGEGRVVGVDLEYEYVASAPGGIVANALHLPFRDHTFGWVFTSCVYGNRMSDHHNAQERCKPCGGTGWDPNAPPGLVGFRHPCGACKGAGKRAYKRLTYKHLLGRDLHRDNAGQMHFPGAKYKALHQEAWPEILRTVEPGGRIILNVSDFFKDKQVQEVTRFHTETLMALGCPEPTVLAEVETRRMKYGAHREERVAYESVLSFQVAA